MSAALSLAPTRLLVGPVLVDITRRTATVGHSLLPLTWAEFEALRLLAEAHGQVVHRDALFQGALRRRAHHAEDRSVDQLVFNLRQKLPTGAQGEPLVRTVRGFGFWIQPGERV